ncbi:MAG TPA: hypothetical protein PKA64_01495 [Myxococcota bacterium]|nr:hypothetical protein [Myxococcota bacterium]
MVDIREAVTGDEREAIFRLRYAIYVEEMGRRQRYADAARRRVEEPLDDGGVLFGAWDEGGELVGTLRVNSRPFGEYHAMYDLDRVGHVLDRCIIATKLMILPRLRHDTRVGFELMAAGYRRVLAEGAWFAFIDCNAHLVRTFSALGFRRYAPPVDHPEYGLVDVMVLGITDVDWMRRVGSPLLPFAPAAGLASEARDALYGSILREPAPTFAPA